MTKDRIESYEEYRDYVENAVDALVDEVENYDDYELQEAVFDTVDSNWLIIYYSNNLDVLRFSDNDPMEWRHMVDSNADYREVIQTMAFDVLRQDVWDEIDRRDIDY